MHAVFVEEAQELRLLRFLQKNTMCIKHYSKCSRPGMDGQQLDKTERYFYCFCLKTMLQVPVKLQTLLIV